MKTRLLLLPRHCCHPISTFLGGFQHDTVAAPCTVVKIVFNCAFASRGGWQFESLRESSQWKGGRKRHQEVSQQGGVKLCRGTLSETKFASRVPRHNSVIHKAFNNYAVEVTGSIVKLEGVDKSGCNPLQDAACWSPL